MITSRLKILSDITCQLYCDGENIGEIISGQLFYLDLRKGKYILEFKIGNLVLDTLRYTMISNDEDDLLEITLLEVYNAINTQQHFELVKNYNVYWSYTGSNWRISSSCNEILNQATNETWIDLPCNYILLPMGSQNDPDIDCCGYIPFNLGGVLHCDEVHGNYVEGGLWGVINKIGETIISPKYDEKVFFRNNQVTSVKSRSQIEVINFLGEQVFKEFILIRPIDENNGLYQVTNNEYKKGIIDRFGRPLMYVVK